MSMSEKEYLIMHLINIGLPCPCPDLCLEWMEWMDVENALWKALLVHKYNLESSVAGCLIKISFSCHATQRKELTRGDGGLDGCIKLEAAVGVKYWTVGLWISTSSAKLLFLRTLLDRLHV